MADRIRTAVVGVGHFGRFHASKYAAIDTAELVAVCDSDPDRAAAAATDLNVRAVADYRELAEAVDAVSVVVPTHAHYEVARYFLDHGVHVLVEKPIAADLAAADDLIARARAGGLVLQVGHLERFSLPQEVLDRVITRPLYIESSRIAPFQLRGSDVSVILDMMIHDIDLILALADAPVESIAAVGAPVLSPREDIANTRIRFDNGCVANITASRISTKSERKLRIFQPESYISIDFVVRRMVVARKLPGETFAGMPNFEIDDRCEVEADPLAREIESFLHAVATGGPPRVTGEDGRRALQTAIGITASLQEHLEFLRARAGDLPGIG